MIKTQVKQSHFNIVHSENNPHHLNIWNETKNYYYLNLLNVGLNKIPLASAEFGSMTDNEFMTWLSNANFQDVEDNVTLHIRQSCLSDDHQNPKCEEKSNTLILPLLLEDNSTLTGGAACLDEFGREFKIPCQPDDVILPFDDKLDNFSIESARKYQEFLLQIKERKKEMVTLMEKLTSFEKSLDVDVDTGEAEDEEVNDVEKEAAELTHSQKVDGKFRKVVDKLNTKIWSAHQSDDPDDVSRLVHYMQINRDSSDTVTDHYGRSILHYAVEEGNLMLAKTLLNVGVNPNVKEKCGATPLTLAVLKKNEKAVKLLLESYAEYNEKFFTTVPGPRVMAEKLKLPPVVQLFDDMSANEAACDEVIWNTVKIGTGSRDHGNCVLDDTDDPEYVHSQSCTFSYYRSSPKNKTLVVGDQGTNKINRSVRAKSAGAYDWVGEVPGDMHARG